MCVHLRLEGVLCVKTVVVVLLGAARRPLWCRRKRRRLEWLL